MKYDGTFEEFVQECMRDIFDSLLLDGTRGMKLAVHRCVNNAVLIGKNNGFKQS